MGDETGRANRGAIANEVVCPPEPSARQHDATDEDVLDTGVMLSKTAKRCPRFGRARHLTRTGGPTVLWMIPNAFSAGAKCPDWEQLGSRARAEMWNITATMR